MSEPGQEPAAELSDPAPVTRQQATRQRLPGRGGGRSCAARSAPGWPARPRPASPSAPPFPRPRAARRRAWPTGCPRCRSTARTRPPSCARPSRSTAVISFDVTAAGRAELTDLMRTITDRARFLTAGRHAAGRSASPRRRPTPACSAPTVVADGLTVTVGVGASLFDDRYGLAARRPALLTPMNPFPNDALDPAQCHGDLSCSSAPGTTDTVLHAMRDIAKHTRGGMQANWRIDGYNGPARPAGTTPRNLLGFMDGIANPAVTDPTLMNELIWVPRRRAGEPAWTAGGSYQVIRLIRMLVEFWDRVSITEQELMIGRRRATGAPLDGNGEFDHPDYAKDPGGAVIPLDRAHPAGQPADPADRVQPHPAPRPQLRPRHRRASATWTWA